MGERAVFSIRITQLVSELTEVKVLCVSAQKEFSKGQSNRQEIDFFGGGAFCLFLTLTPTYECSQAMGLIGAIATSLCHSHSNSGSMPSLQPTPQLTATLYP